MRGGAASQTCTPTTQLLRRHASVRGPVGICSRSRSVTLTSARALLICARACTHNHVSKRPYLQQDISRTSRKRWSMRGRRVLLICAQPAPANAGKCSKGLQTRPKSRRANQREGLARICNSPTTIIAFHAKCSNMHAACCGATTLQSSHIPGWAGACRRQKWRARPAPAPGARPRSRRGRRAPRAPCRPSPIYDHACPHQQPCRLIHSRGLRSLPCMRPLSAQAHFDGATQLSRPSAKTFEI